MIERGVFFIFDGISIGDAEDYVDFKDHDVGHYEFWNELRALGPGVLIRIVVPEDRQQKDWLHSVRGGLSFLSIQDMEGLNHEQENFS